MRTYVVVFVRVRVYTCHNAQASYYLEYQERVKFTARRRFVSFTYTKRVKSRPFDATTTPYVFLLGRIYTLSFFDVFVDSSFLCSYLLGEWLEGKEGRKKKDVQETTKKKRTKNNKK